MTEAADVTRLLNLAASGDAEAGERAWRAVYTEVHAIASRQLHRERGGQTLSPTGLIHEAYAKLVAPARPQVEDRGHFYALACRAMRQVLVEKARARSARKRGGGVAPVTLQADLLPSAETRDEALIELDEALTGLGDVSPRLASVVECRFFGGLTFQETADALGISLRTAEREWARARTYLFSALTADE